MADISITAADVIAGSTATVARGTAGATITAGQVVARASNGTYVLADNNSATASVRAACGLALNGAATGQPLSVATDGPVTLSAVMTAGVAYYLSDTPGGICPVADLQTGEYPVLLGMATSTSSLTLGILNSGVAL